MLSFGQKCDSRTDRMTETSRLITAVFFSLYKLQKTLTVTMLLLIGPVMLLYGTCCFIHSHSRQLASAVPLILPPEVQQNCSKMYIIP